MYIPTYVPTCMLPLGRFLSDIRVQGRMAAGPPLEMGRTEALAGGTSNLPPALVFPSMYRTNVGESP